MGNMREEVNKWVETNNLILKRGKYVPKRKSSKYIKEVRVNESGIFKHKRSGSNT